MNKRFNFLDFLKTGMFSGAGWTALAILCYILFYYGYSLYYFYPEKSTAFAVEKVAIFILLLIFGVIINGIIGLGLGTILAVISYGIFPRPYETERIYRNSLHFVTIITVLIVGTVVWRLALCMAIGLVYMETLIFVMMLNLLIFGRISHHCSSSYLSRGKAKTA